MKILFVHQNFPGQFRRLAPALAARGHQVMTLTAEHNTQASPVLTYRYPMPDPEPDPRHSRLGTTFTAMTDRAHRVARAAQQMRDQLGIVPDVIFGHTGWGETLFLREVWPEARLLTYAEFYYASRGLDVGFDPEFDSDTLASRYNVVARQAHLALAMLQADAALAPTEWQADSFAPEFRDKITIIHDGIDTDYICPDPGAAFRLPSGQVLRAGDEVLSFVNRNLEPYRGFHIFMRALPDLLAARPQAQVVIVGGDEVSYGAVPASGGSWRQLLLHEVGDRLDMRRVHFTGRIPYADFRSLMQVARVHAYLSVPFVLSWSMLEAMSAGAMVVGSRTGPVEEVLRDGISGRLVDFFDIEGWSDTLATALADPESARAIGQVARAQIIENYDLKRLCLPRLIRFVEDG